MCQHPNQRQCQWVKTGCLRANESPLTNSRVSASLGLNIKAEEEQVATILEKYSQCLKAGDAAGMATLFAEDGEFYDDAPSALGLQAISVKGRGDIENFFRETFKRGGLDVGKVAINGNAMRYDVAVGKTVLLCLGVLKEENGLIKEYRVVAV
jgi:hypothetical protein